MEKKRPAIFVVAFYFFLIISLVSCGMPNFEYTIEEIHRSNSMHGLPPEKLDFKTKGDSVIINQIVYWPGTYRPRLKKEANIIKIIFTQEQVSSLMEAFNFKATISNLQPGEYKVQMLYETWEYLLEGEKEWRRSSKLLNKKVVNRRKIFRKSNEFDVMIESPPAPR